MPSPARDALGRATGIHRRLCGLERTNNAKPAGPVGQGRLAGRDAVDEVLELDLEWLDEVDLRNEDVAGTEEELELGVRFEVARRSGIGPAGPRNALVVDRDPRVRAD